MSRSRQEKARDFSDLKSLIKSRLGHLSPDDQKEIFKTFSPWFEVAVAAGSESSVERCVFLLWQISNDEKWRKKPRPVVHEHHKNSLFNSSKKIVEAFSEFEKKLASSGVLDFLFAKKHFYNFQLIFQESYTKFFENICLEFNNYQKQYGAKRGGRPTNSTRDMDIIGLIACIKDKEDSLEKAIESTRSLLSSIGITLSDDSLHRIWKTRNLPGGRRLARYRKEK